MICQNIGIFEETDENKLNEEIEGNKSTWEERQHEIEQINNDIDYNNHYYNQSRETYSIWQWAIPWSGIGR